MFERNDDTVQHVRSTESGAPRELSLLKAPGGLLPYIFRTPVLRAQPELQEIVELGSNHKGLHRRIAHMLLARRLAQPLGFERSNQTVSEVEAFLSPRLGSLPLPKDLKGWSNAVKRLEQAVRTQERVAIMGDFDVDGLSSASIMAEVLSGLSDATRIRVYIPHRFVHGYGLNRRLIEQAHADGCSLVVSLDMGTNNAAELREAKSRGLDTIVIDHHHISADSDICADVLVNPHQSGCGFTSYRMAAAGLTWYVAAGLVRQFPDAEIDSRQLLDLAALGTICDLVPLIGPNRILACCGLEKLSHGARPGIKELASLFASRGLSPRDKLGTREVGYHIGPCINAAGRLGEAGQVVEFLTTKNGETAVRLARWLFERNTERQRIERTVVQAAEQQLTGVAAHDLPFGVVVSGDEFHVGVVGLAAQRVSDRVARPVAVIGCDPNGELRGSVRGGSEGFSVAEALTRCGSYLKKFGGHASAGGFSLERHQLEPFRKAFDEEIRRQCGGVLPIPEVKADIVARSLADLSARVIRELEVLGPFGQGNARPLTLCKGLLVTYVREVSGSSKEISIVLSLHDGRREITATFWRCGSAHGFRAGMFVTVAIAAELRLIRGQEQRELTVRGIREALAEEIPPKTRSKATTLIKIDNFQQGDLLEIPRLADVPMRDRKSFVYRETDNTVVCGANETQLSFDFIPPNVRSSKSGQTVVSITELCQIHHLPLVRAEAIQSRRQQLALLDKYFKSDGNFHLTASTGAGKTLFALIALSKDIARGERVFFLAPREVLLQQAYKEALRFLKLPADKMRQLGGSVPPSDRPSAYHDLNVQLIFATPEVIQNDIARGVLSLKFFSRVVMDEIHLMRGEYAYRAVNRALDKEDLPRITLSATPGGTSDKLRDLELTLGVDTFRSPGDRGRVRREERFVVSASEDFRCAQLCLEKGMRVFALETFDALRPFEGYLRHFGQMYGLPMGPFKMASRHAMRAFVAELKRLPQTPQNNKIASKSLALDHLLLLHESLASYGQEFFLSRVAPHLWDLASGARIPKFIREVYSSSHVHQAIEVIARGSPYERLIPSAESRGMLPPPPDNIGRSDFLRAATRQMKQRMYCDHPKERLMWDLLEAHFEARPDARVIVFSRYAHVAMFVSDRLNYFFSRSKASQRAVWVVGRGSAPASVSAQNLQDFQDCKAQVLVGSPAINEGLNIPEVPLAIFYDHGTNPEERVQREGRVGRGRTRGTVYVMNTAGTADELSYLIGRGRLKKMKNLLRVS